MLAHQGGWDEFLYAAVPILLIVGLLRLATKRAKQQQRELAEQETANPVVTTDELD